MTKSQELGQENLRLFSLWKETKDEEYFKKIIVNLSGFVRKISSDLYFSKDLKYRSKVSLEEVTQEGYLGAIAGLKKFDIKRGYAITTYLYSWIWAYCDMYMKSQFEFKLATTNAKRKAIVSLYRDADKFVDEKDGQIDLEALAKYSGIDSKTLEEVRTALASKFVNLSSEEDEDQISNDDLFHRHIQSPDILLDIKTKLDLLELVRKIYLKRFKDEGQNVYFDLLNDHILPDENSEFKTKPATLDYIAQKNNYPDKRYVDNFKKKLLESLRKTYLELYRYGTINGEKIDRGSLPA